MALEQELETTRDPVPVLLWLFGVLLPWMGFWIEHEMKAADAAGRDPFPDALMTGLAVAALLCSTTLVVLLTGKRREAGAPHAFAWGFLTAVSAFYSLALLPLLPAIFIGIVIVFPVLGLAPYFALITCIRLHRYLLVQPEHSKRFWGWFLFGLFLPVLLIANEEYRVVRLDAQIRRAANGSAESRADAIEWLRAHSDGFAITGLLGGESDVRFWRKRLRSTRLPQPAQEQLVYRATGRVPADFARSIWSRAGLLGGANFDRPFIPELFPFQVELMDSSLQVILEPEAGIASLDWVMELRSQSFVQEADLVLRIPPGAVASYLSLRIEDREALAAFDEVSRTQKAYDAVAVRQRRDPALLNRLDADRLSLRVFPVEAGASRRVRIGLTVPLRATLDEQWSLTLPTIVSGNVDALDVRHRVSIEGAPIHWKDGTAEADRSLSQDEFARGASLQTPLLMDRVTWTGDKRGFVRQSLEPKPESDWQGPLVVVIDGKSSDEARELDWQQLLSQWPASTQVTVLVAADRVERYTGRISDTELPSWIRDQLVPGGVDPVPALIQALEADGRVLWLYQDLPMEFPAELAIEPSRSKIVAWPIRPGENRVLSRLRSLSVIEAIPVTGDLVRDIGSWVRLGQAEMREGAARRTFERLDEEPEQGQEVSQHLARLWAAREVEAMLEKGEDEAATELANAYRIVTEVSGAVVLETPEQYEEHGLDPAAESDVDRDWGEPVPEPAVIVLFLAGLGAFAWRVKRRGVG